MPSGADPTVQVRPMRADDWPEVRRIYAAGIATGDATFETEPPDWEHFDAAKSADHRLVAERNGVVVGWVAVSGVSERCVYAGVVEHSVYVDPSHAGHGIGTALLRALIASTEAAGVWTIQTGIFPENEASLALTSAAASASSADGNASASTSGAGGTSSSSSDGAQPSADVCGLVGPMVDSTRRSRCPSCEGRVGEGVRSCVRCMRGKRRDEDADLSSGRGRQGCVPCDVEFIRDRQHGEVACVGSTDRGAATREPVDDVHLVRLERPVGAGPVADAVVVDQRLGVGSDHVAEPPPVLVRQQGLRKAVGPVRGVADRRQLNARSHLPFECERVHPPDVVDQPSPRVLDPVRAEPALQRERSLHGRLRRELVRSMSDEDAGKF
jgi:L-amino acid N-acyltransferase YncA